MVRFTKESNKIGGWTFLVGVVLAIVLGALGPLSQMWITILVLIGLIVGFLNIASSEVKPFLMSGAVLIIASAFGNGVLQTIPVASDILTALLAIFVPATIVAAVKNVFSLARN